MNKKLKHIAILVDDYDEALKFYVQKLNFILIEDTKLSDTKRWVLVAPSKSSECNFLLSKASNEEQKKHIGNQTGGRVFLFLNTESFDDDYKNLIENKIKIIRNPKIEK
jgi:catechol 2,3-dioxygenase-like lactoylglutathione lyase family enzyme